MEGGGACGAWSPWDGLQRRGRLVWLAHRRRHSGCLWLHGLLRGWRLLQWWLRLLGWDCLLWLLWRRLLLHGRWL